MRGEYANKPNTGAPNLAAYRFYNNIRLVQTCTGTGPTRVTQILYYKRAGTVKII